jgi:hypothetical protein
MKENQFLSWIFITILYSDANAQKAQTWYCEESYKQNLKSYLYILHGISVILGRGPATLPRMHYWSSIAIYRRRNNVRNLVDLWNDFGAWWKAMLQFNTCTIILFSLPGRCLCPVLSWKCSLCFLNLPTFIDRFHSRDRWPQWCGETIRNIWIRKS